MKSCAIPITIATPHIQASMLFIRSRASGTESAGVMQREIEKGILTCLKLIANARECIRRNPGRM